MTGRVIAITGAFGVLGSAVATAAAEAGARLALIEGGPEAAAPMLDARPRSGTVFLVSAQNDRVPARLLRASRRSTVLVLPAELRPAHRAFPSFEVSGCRGYLLTGGQVSDSAQRAA